MRISEWLVFIAIIIMLCVLFCGCQGMPEGEYINVDEQVVGFKASMPGDTIGASPITVWLGYINTSYSHGTKVKITKHAKQSDINIWKLSGTIEREVEITP